MIASHQYLSFCASQQEGCIRDWRNFSGQQFDYVYLTAGCCGAELIRTIMSSPDYTPVYVNEAVGIWRMPQPATGQSSGVSPPSG
jgi:hypothetical protein